MPKPDRLDERRLALGVDGVRTASADQESIDDFVRLPLSDDVEGGAAASEDLVGVGALRKKLVHGAQAAANGHVYGGHLGRSVDRAAPIDGFGFPSLWQPPEGGGPTSDSTSGGGRGRREESHLIQIAPPCLRLLQSGGVQPGDRRHHRHRTDNGRQQKKTPLVKEDQDNSADLEEKPELR